MKSFITKIFLGLLLTLPTSQCLGMQQQRNPRITEAEVKRAQLEIARNTRTIADDVLRRNADRGFCGWFADHTVPATLGGVGTLIGIGKYHRIIKRLISFARGNCLIDYVKIPDLCGATAMISTVGLFFLEPAAIMGVLYLVYKFSKLSIRQKLLLASSLAVLGIALTVAWL